MLRCAVFSPTTYNHVREYYTLYNEDGRNFSSETKKKKSLSDLVSVYICTYTLEQRIRLSSRKLFRINAVPHSAVFRPCVHFFFFFLVLSLFKNNDQRLALNERRKVVPSGDLVKTN